ncbi:hypothetical protein Tco_1118311, partial [Tanacetum coccineum]
MHVAPPPMTGNYMPSGPGVEIDYSQFTYGLKQSQPSESETQTSDFDTCESDSSEPTINEPKVVSQPKVWSDAPIIEEETVKNPFTNSKNAKVDKKGLGYRLRKKSSQREIRSIWNNVQRVNHQNQFVPKAVLTRTAKILVSTARASGTNNVNTARHNFNSQAVLTNAARKISIVKSFVNRDYPHKALKNKGIVDSGCSRHMTGNKAYLAEYQDFNG